MKSNWVWNPENQEWVNLDKFVYIYCECENGICSVYGESLDTSHRKYFMEYKYDVNDKENSPFEIQVREIKSWMHDFIQGKFKP